MARVGGSVGTSRGFLQAVNKWTKATKERSEEAFKIGVLDFFIHLRDTTPIDTGFLRSSLTAGINGNVPSGPNAAYGSVYNDQRVLSVIDQLKLGEKITLVYQATYARRLEYGFSGADSLDGFTINLVGSGLLPLGLSMRRSCALRQLDCVIARRFSVVPAAGLEPTSLSVTF
jgi:hypothetical protein